MLLLVPDKEPTTLTRDRPFGTSAGIVAALVSGLACVLVAGPVARLVAAPQHPTPAACADAEACTVVEVEETGDNGAGRLVTMLDKQRVSTGCRPLVRRPELERAAGRHAADMTRSRFVGHLGTDGSSAFIRAQDAGYRASVDEFIAAGLVEPEAALAAMLTGMGGAGVSASLLDCRWASAGVAFSAGESRGGLAHGVWVVVLGVQ